MVVTEYVEGVDLNVYKSRSLPLDDCLDVLAQSSKELAAMHKRGVAHTSVCEKNIIVQTSGKVRCPSHIFYDIYFSLIHALRRSNATTFCNYILMVLLTRLF